MSLRLCVQPLPAHAASLAGAGATVANASPAVETPKLTVNWAAVPIAVELHAFLRPEWVLPDIEALKRQIALDCDAARRALA